MRFFGTLAVFASILSSSFVHGDQDVNDEYAAMMAMLVNNENDTNTSLAVTHTRSTIHRELAKKRTPKPKSKKGAKKDGKKSGKKSPTHPPIPSPTDKPTKSPSKAPSMSPMDANGPFEAFSESPTPAPPSNCDTAKNDECDGASFELFIMRVQDSGLKFDEARRYAQSLNVPKGMECDLASIQSKFEYRTVQGLINFMNVDLPEKGPCYLGGKKIPGVRKTNKAVEGTSKYWKFVDGKCWNDNLMPDLFRNSEPSKNSNSEQFLRLKYMTNVNKGWLEDEISGGAHCYIRKCCNK
jgi:hypothetical protein